tara:strand:+ start:444 stop:716 length:273 start_codon:yes stop_codon:yes gene_type:complete
VTIVVGLFSFFYVDLNLFRQRSPGNNNKVSISIEVNDQKEKLKRKRQNYKNKKYKKKIVYKKQHFALKGTHAKDKRFSNQKTLRRMYRNC